MRGQLKISPEVSQSLGEARAEALRRDGASGPCPICRAEVSTLHGDNASVLIESYLNEIVIVFSHDTCAESQIIYMGRTSAEIPSDDVSSVWIVVPGARENRALIFVTPDSPGTIYLHNGEKLSPWVAGLMVAGWEVLSSVGRSAILLSDWSAHIDPDANRLVILDSTGAPMLEQQMRGDNQLWFALALTTGEVSIATGDVDIDRIMLADNRVMELQRLAKLGQLIGVRVPAQRVRAQLDPFTTASRSLADTLAAAIRRRARPMRAGKVQAFGVNLPTAPRVYPILVKDSALLVIDLDDFDEARGRKTLEALIAAGFPSGIADSDEHFLRNASRDLSCLVWRSQIQILGRGANAKPRELLFVPFQAAGNSWLQAVQAYRAVGIVIGNLVNNDKLENLIDELRDGRMVGAAFLAVPATET